MMGMRGKEDDGTEYQNAKRYKLHMRQSHQRVDPVAMNLHFEHKNEH